MIASPLPHRSGARHPGPPARSPSLIGLYLLFAGHNNPGGGFAAGLVFGAVVTLRTVVPDCSSPAPRHRADRRRGDRSRGRRRIAPLLWGDPLLDQKVVTVDCRCFGKVKSGSALPFDIGVTAIVVGLVLALLDGLSATAARRGRRAGPTPTRFGSEEVNS